MAAGDKHGRIRHGAKPPIKCRSQVSGPPCWPSAGPLFTQEAVQLMKPLWCTAGWGVSVPHDGVISPTGGEQQLLYPFLKRFPGMEVIDYLDLCLPHFNKAMYSVNWLNFVSDSLLDKLGGREAVGALAANDPLLHAPSDARGLCPTGSGRHITDQRRALAFDRKVLLRRSH